MLTSWMEQDSTGARVSEQVKSQTSGKPLIHGIKVMPSGLLPLSKHMPTGSRTAGTPPDTKARRIVSLTAACRYGRHYTYMCSKTSTFTHAKNTSMLNNNGDTKGYPSLASQTLFRAGLIAFSRRPRGRVWGIWSTFCELG